MNSELVTRRKDGGGNSVVVLFLLVMDPLLSKLQSSGIGLSINNFCAGGFLHPDDICTVVTSPQVCGGSSDYGDTFVGENFLQLSINKHD